MVYFCVDVCMPDNSCSLLRSKCCGWLNQLSVNRFCWEIMRRGGWVSRFLPGPAPATHCETHQHNISFHKTEKNWKIIDENKNSDIKYPQ